MAVKPQLTRIVPIIVYVGLIFFFSSRQNLHAPGPEFEAKDKVAHFLEYCILGILLFKGIGWSASRDKVANLLFLFAVGVSVAALDELFQSYIPGRTMSLLDWMADAAGIAVGVGLFVLTRLGRHKNYAT
jgi:VanZ family protein